jgi:Uma2 family endonuclease
MPTQIEKHYYTPEEYLALEEVAEYKSEYHDGQIIPMTGGTTNHNEIAGNFYSHFKFAFRGQNYRIYMGNVRLWIPRYRRYTYPDVMVIEGAPVYEGTGTTTVTNPLLIVEVLSKSTTNYDQGEKFRYYRSIPEFREYILIDQYSFHVEQFSKNLEGKWVLTEYELQDSALALDSIEFQFSLSDLYEGVNFELSEE